MEKFPPFFLCCVESGAIGCQETIRLERDNGTYKGRKRDISRIFDFYRSINVTDLMESRARTHTDTHIFKAFSIGTIYRNQ